MAVLMGMEKGSQHPEPAPGLHAAAMEHVSRIPQEQDALPGRRQAGARRRGRQRETAHGPLERLPSGPAEIHESSRPARAGRTPIQHHDPVVREGQDAQGPRAPMGTQARFGFQVAPGLGGRTRDQDHQGCGKGAGGEAKDAGHGALPIMDEAKDDHRARNK